MSTPNLPRRVNLAAPQILRPRTREEPEDKSHIEPHPQCSRWSKAKAAKAMNIEGRNRSWPRTHRHGMPYLRGHAGAEDCDVAVLSPK
jgi:hypothetical protein